MVDIMSILFHLQTQRLKKGLGKDMKEKELKKLEEINQFIMSIEKKYEIA